MNLHSITAIRLTTADPDRLAIFYAALGFTVGERHPIPAAELAMLGISGGGTRTPLTLGSQQVDLDYFSSPASPYPADATGADTVSRHPALVTGDARAAWAKALAAGATPISRHGPVDLPASAGGVTAAKFRDPEGHPLEFLQFPPGSDGARKWGGGDGLLGIDHVALAVLQTEAAKAFFAGLGLAVGSAGLNHGPTQEALDGLPDPRVDVVPLKTHGPGANLELLGYHQPQGRHFGPIDALDVASLRIVWNADRDGVVRDVSGHLHLLVRA